MNYLEHAHAVVEKHMRPDTPTSLCRLYTLLALTTGTATTRRHVHDAWSMWRTIDDPTHRSVVPYEARPTHVQAYDQPYVDAIHAAARELARNGNAS